MRVSPLRPVNVNTEPVNVMARPVFASTSTDTVHFSGNHCAVDAQEAERLRHAQSEVFIRKDFDVELPDMEAKGKMDDAIMRQAHSRGFDKTLVQYGDLLSPHRLMALPELFPERDTQSLIYWALFQQMLRGVPGASEAFVQLNKTKGLKPEELRVIITQAVEQCPKEMEALSQQLAVHVEQANDHLPNSEQSAEILDLARPVADEAFQVFSEYLSKQETSLDQMTYKASYWGRAASNEKLDSVARDKNLDIKTRLLADIVLIYRAVLSQDTNAKDYILSNRQFLKDASKYTRSNTDISEILDKAFDMACVDLGIQSKNTRIILTLNASGVPVGYRFRDWTSSSLN